MLQTSFRVRIPRAEFDVLCQQYAQRFHAIPGLVGRACLFNETRGEGGGLYLFETREALRAFVDGPIMTEVRSNPALENVRLKTLDVLEDSDAVTQYDRGRGY